MSFTDAHCGVPGAHWHTGELTESHFVEYWCGVDVGGCDPLGVAWVRRRYCVVEGNEHTKARTQSTTTEIIELIPDEQFAIKQYLYNEMLFAFEKKFFDAVLYGENGRPE